MGQVGNKSSGGSTLPLILGLVAVGGGGYWYMTQTSEGKDLSHDAKAEAKELRVSKP